MDTLLPRNAISIIRGSSKAIELAIRKDGAAFDLTGVALYFTVAEPRYPDAAEAPENPTPVIEKTSEDGIEVTSAPYGLATITILPADTAELVPGDYLYDVWAVVQDAQFCVVEPTLFQIRAGVTRLPAATS